MRFSFLDTPAVTPAQVKSETKKLTKYREEIATIETTADDTKPEYGLSYANNAELQETLSVLKKGFKGVKHVVLIGIGGSSLGVEAVHSVLDTGKVTLSVLDTISAHELTLLEHKLAHHKKLSDIVICVMSKSGGTTETLVNAGVLFGKLEKKFGAKVYEQVIFIGDVDSPLKKEAKKLDATYVAMPKSIGGRYSVATAVGLVPLTLLGHDVDAFIEGISDASTNEYEFIAAEGAARIALYLKKNFTHYNFFAFEKRLAALGAWYRQLFAESIGKNIDRTGKPFKKCFVPTISTPVELHSIGQLYLSGFPSVYTDFVTFDDELAEAAIPKKGIAKQFSKFSAEEVATAIYGGVAGAYTEGGLPHRATIFDEELPYSLGLFMGIRMRETMYVAELMNVDAFNQPNVELYKQKTKAILGL
jgi:glucose-6-phosphate isomerase